MKKLISFTIKAEFGMFKKPDINDKIFITYNMIPKPNLLGMLGAIVGYGGYIKLHNRKISLRKRIENCKDEEKKLFEKKLNDLMPEYYEKLKDIRVAIAPSNENGGIYKKEFIIFNNTTNGKISNITEQTLVNPAYRIYLELDEIKHKTIIDNLRENRAVYPPYMGKNEFSLWWDNFHIHTKFEKIELIEKFEVKTIIKKDKDFKFKNSGYKERTTNYFYLFERLPIGFDKELKQYTYYDFLYTNAVFKTNEGLNNLYECDEGIICLF